MYLINLFFCFLAVYFMAECKDNYALFWLNALSLVLNFAAFAMGVLI
jgi:hypothetical protein